VHVAGLALALSRTAHFLLRQNGREDDPGSDYVMGGQLNSELRLLREQNIDLMYTNKTKDRTFN
jgi:hypothetical protein